MNPPTAQFREPGRQPEPARRRPKSPNIQHYRPQLTSVLSIANRMTALIATLALLVFVVWLVAAAVSPGAYATLHAAAASPIGMALMIIASYAFFLHLCGSIRHLMWDSGAGFELRAIYASGWAALGASIVLTAAAWVAGWLLRG